MDVCSIYFYRLMGIGVTFRKRGENNNKDEGFAKRKERQSLNNIKFDNNLR